MLGDIACAGILQADAFDGYNRLYLPDRKPGPIVERCVGAMRNASSSSWPIELSKHRQADAQPALAIGKRLRSQAEEVLCTQCSQPGSEWNSDRLCTSLSGMNSCIM